MQHCLPVLGFRSYICQTMPFFQDVPCSYLIAGLHLALCGLTLETACTGGGTWLDCKQVICFLDRLAEFVLISLTADCSDCTVASANGAAWFRWACSFGLISWPVFAVPVQLVLQLQLCGPLLKGLGKAAGIAV